MIATPRQGQVDSERSRQGNQFYVPAATATSLIQLPDSNHGGISVDSHGDQRDHHQHRQKLRRLKEETRALQSPSLEALDLTGVNGWHLPPWYR